MGEKKPIVAIPDNIRLAMERLENLPCNFNEYEAALKKREKWVETTLRTYAQPPIKGEITIGKLKWRGIKMTQIRFDNHDMTRLEITQRGNTIGVYCMITEEEFEEIASAYLSDAVPKLAFTRDGENYYHIGTALVGERLLRSVMGEMMDKHKD